MTTRERLALFFGTLALIVGLFISFGLLVPGHNAAARAEWMRMEGLR